MLEQYDLIHNTDWNTLIILDACRFDYFKKCVTLGGKLSRCWSRAPHTYRWLEETFPDYYGWTYFSAHPYVGAKVSRRRGFNAPEHFGKIVSIWALAWDDRLGTVHPDSVGEVVKIMCEREEYGVGDKMIVHYIQPHGPWIGKTKWVVPWTLEQHEKYGVMADYVAQKVKPDPKFFRRAYRDNLKLVLGSIKKYLPYFKGKVVITADHGEMLGEKGLYLHKENYPAWTDSILRVVPWFEISRPVADAT